MKAHVSRYRTRNSAGVLWLYALQLAPITIALTGIAAPAIASTNPPAPVGETLPTLDGDRLPLGTVGEASARTVVTPETVRTIEHSDAPSRQANPLRQQMLPGDADALISASIAAANPAPVSQINPIIQTPKPEPKQPASIAPGSQVLPTPKATTDSPGDRSLPTGEAPLCPVSSPNQVENLPTTIEPTEFKFIKGTKKSKKPGEWEGVEFSSKEKRWLKSKDIDLDALTEALTKEYRGQKLQPSELGMRI